ncbi:hypothetical protein BU16DRAFT_554419 [Lophium mytilinum]|uniref:Fucose-specific lectin n=1 Tax=Lophium mytilinum TaxID=390894 RepID=A0A6A6RD12_9PEZI|nr:hypothetical protein BU16DRAFT_554419 [Lophium mytilinum]
MWLERLLPTTVPVRRSTGWVAMNDPGSGGPVKGAIWFKIGTFGQINIDFENAAMAKKNYYGVYTSDDGGRCATSISGTTRSTATTRRETTRSENLAAIIFARKLDLQWWNSRTSFTAHTKEKMLDNYGSRRLTARTRAGPYNTYDASSWSGDRLVRDESIMSESSTAVVWNDKLHCFFQRPNQNGELNYVVCDGNSCTASQKIPSVGMSASPTAAVVDGKIRIFHYGWGSNGQLWSLLFGDTPENTPVVGVGLSYSPAVAAEDVGNTKLKLHTTFCVQHLWSPPRLTR